MRTRNPAIDRAIIEHRETIAARFWPRVEIADGCWLWTGARDSDGYGNVGLPGRLFAKAHRVAFLLTHGLVEADLFICHDCDNPPCVRPDHLHTGTNSQNQREAYDRGLNVSRNRLKTKCIRGHAFDDANTGINCLGNRYCITCNRVGSRERMRVKRLGIESHSPAILPISA